MKALILLSVCFSANAISAGGSSHLVEDVERDIHEINLINHEASSIPASTHGDEANTDSRVSQLPGYKPTNIEPQIDTQTVCESLVCESIKQAESVPVIGDVPKREGNKTLEALTSAIYIAGEVGLADNHAEPDPEIDVLD
ncbi:hypothetical protein [Vibrio sp. 99-70-13A1]|uniref:hypothetical protein n=1 Tax=Vibrio sp. 99-70-13A1 TaxID=2607601 RepID=UPI0014936217|nr:hypothetical protein [Vibrio sp. 99-70-13A1]NOH97010.1 hypothetical protein [Vibrio sp. 99-70-13A1]